MTDQIKHAPARAVTRLTLAYFMRWVTSVNRAFDGDLLMGIVFMAVLHANISWLSEDTSVASTYGEVDKAPPDTLRRPVSARALAVSLGLPRETVRRQVEKLVAQGWIVKDERQRLLAPTSVLASPLMSELSVRAYASFSDLISTLRRMDLLPEG